MCAHPHLQMISPPGRIIVAREDLRMPFITTVLDSVRQGCGGPKKIKYPTPTPSKNTCVLRKTLARTFPTSTFES